jgi:hypothetical protein
MVRSIGVEKILRGPNWTHGPKKRKKGTWREAKFPFGIAMVPKGGLESPRFSPPLSYRVSFSAIAATWRPGTSLQPVRSRTPSSLPAGVSGVCRSGKFPPGPKGVLMDDDRVDVCNLHDSPLKDAGFGRRGLGRWDGGRENRKEVEGEEQIDCIIDFLYIPPREIITGGDYEIRS